MSRGRRSKRGNRTNQQHDRVTFPPLPPAPASRSWIGYVLCYALAAWAHRGRNPWRMVGLAAAALALWRLTR